MGMAFRDGDPRVRMVLAGTLDRHPRLRLVIGHMGEMLPVMLARIDEVSALDIEHLKRPISRAILDQVWLTTSGNLQRAAISSCAANIRDRPHHVLGRLSLCAQCKGS